MVEKTSATPSLKRTDRHSRVALLVATVVGINATFQAKATLIHFSVCQFSLPCLSSLELISNAVENVRFV